MMVESLNIHYYDLVKNVLGFGNRLVFWTAGCPFSCKGCIEEKLQNEKSGHLISTPKLFNKIKHIIPKINGITFSGGEPLWQSRNIQQFISYFPSEIDKMLFTGYVYSELDQNQRECFNLFDLVVEGRFEINKIGNFLWRGSENQQFISPTQKYNPIMKDLYLQKSAGLDIKVNNKTIDFYGIPTMQNEINILKNTMRNKGINT